MAGVPDFIDALGWWAIAIFLFVAVFFRTQATYWVGRWVRSGAASLATEPDRHPRLARVSARLSGPRLERGQALLDRWGFVAIPLSFLTVGIQTLVNAAAGYGRMRWDLYTLVMIPGCILWVGAYFAVGASAYRLWHLSPWLLLGAVVVVVLAAWSFTTLRRRSAAPGARQPAD